MDIKRLKKGNSLIAIKTVFVREIKNSGTLLTPYIINKQDIVYYDGRIGAIQYLKTVDNRRLEILNRSLHWWNWNFVRAG